jgi:exonuclease SbcD
MKILSFGDMHFNAGYDEDILASVNQIIEYVRQNPIGLVVIAGDVYERASDPDSRNIAADCIQALGDVAPVVVIRGNHDAPGDLQILKKLECAQGIGVLEIPASIIYGTTIVHFMPWLTKARWQSLHPGASKEEGDKTVSQLVLEFLKTNVALDSGYRHILVGHVTIAGAKAQNHQQMGADGVTLGMYDLPEAGFFAAILGHIHLRQTLGENDRFFYNGSVAALDYGESPEKFFSVLDDETGEVEWVKLNTVHRQDINAYWTPTGICVDEDVPQSLLAGARVRANLRVEGGDNVDQAKAQLEAFLQNAGALEYKINPQVIPVSKVRAVEISQAVKMSDKLKEFWLATVAPDEITQKDMLEKLAELEDACFL